MIKAELLFGALVLGSFIFEIAAICGRFKNKTGFIFGGLSFFLNALIIINLRRATLQYSIPETKNTGWLNNISTNIESLYQNNMLIAFYIIIILFLFTLAIWKSFGNKIDIK